MTPYDPLFHPFDFIRILLVFIACLTFYLAGWFVRRQNSSGAFLFGFIGMLELAALGLIPPTP